MQLQGTEELGFAAKTFGAIYESLLNHAFTKQKHTKKKYAHLRWVGGAWVRPKSGGTKIKQDFLLSWVPDARRRRSFICFEAKCWPGYKKFVQLTAENAEDFATGLGNFKYYLNQRRGWYVHRSPEPQADKSKPGRPGRFGVIVFDYKLEDREAILKILQKKVHRDLTELESVCDLLSTTELHKTLRTDTVLLEGLRKKRRAALKILDLFLP